MSPTILIAWGHRQAARRWRRWLADPSVQRLVCPAGNDVLLDGRFRALRLAARAPG
jgi:hypothetical protein